MYLAVFLLHYIEPGNETKVHVESFVVIIVGKMAQDVGIV